MKRVPRCYDLIALAKDEARHRQNDATATQHRNVAGLTSRIPSDGRRKLEAKTELDGRSKLVRAQTS